MTNAELMRLTVSSIFSIRRNQMTDNEAINFLRKFEMQHASIVAMKNI